MNERDYLRRMSDKVSTPKTPIKSTSIYAPHKLMTKVRKASEDYGVSMSAIIRRALAVYLDILDGVAEVHHLEK